MIIFKILFCILPVFVGIFTIKKGPDAFKEYQIPKSFHYMVGVTDILMGIVFFLQILEVI